jgi:hypothetical protein
MVRVAAQFSGEPMVMDVSTFVRLKLTRGAIFPNISAEKTGFRALPELLKVRL